MIAYIRRWFSDGHPLGFHLAALGLALLSVATVVTTSILAQETTSTATMGSTSTTACVYSYSSWGMCQSNGTRTRSVTGVSPSGCIQATAPLLSEACTYSGGSTSTTSTPTSTVSTSTTACVYSYGSWGACQSDGNQYRSVTNASPTGCTSSTAPVTKQTCTYPGGSTSTTSTPTSTVSTSTTACVYSYGSWGACQSDGKRYRPVISASPTGCTSTAAPYTVESCSSSGSASTSTSASTATATTSSASTSTNQCSFTYSEWSACQSNGKRVRSWLSKYPTGCVEYTHPVLEQSCIFDGSTTTTSSTNAMSSNASSSYSGSTQMMASTTSSTTQGSGTSSGATAVTPPFSFMNVGENMVIRGDIEIRGTVTGAQTVEYYLVPVGSNTYKYIGSAQAKSATEWSLKFHSSDFPNGDFYLRARVKNLYGEYGSGQRKISIRNESQGTAEVTTSQSGFVSLEMSTATKVEMLQQTAQELQIPVDATVPADNPDQQKKYIFDYCQANVDKCAPERDSDQDGLSDIDEVRYGTNPKLADTDLDGFLDGDEVKNGFDPLKYSGGDQSDRVVFESPKDAGETKKDVYVIGKVALDEAAVGTDTQKIHFSGKGLPNSFVTLYIFSDPIVLTVKTDSEGNWTYELDKELENGQHEAYVAVTDNTGKITAKSEPLPFIKTAQAVTVIPAAQAAPVVTTQAVSENRATRDLLLLMAIIIAALAAALATIGLVKHRHMKAAETALRP